MLVTIFGNDTTILPPLRCLHDRWVALPAHYFFASPESQWIRPAALPGGARAPAGGSFCRVPIISPRDTHFAA